MAASQLDLSLPDKVPEMEQYHEANLLPFALYTLCNLSERDLNQLCVVCQSKCQLHEGQAQVLLPPQSCFIGQPLRAIVDYHVGLARNGQFDPRYIIIAVYQDWETHGVLVVTLNGDDFICRPDSLWSKAEESGLTLVNLQILNTDWYEAKETLALHNHQDENNDYDGETGNNHILDHDHGDNGSDDYGAPPPVGYHIAVYVTKGIDVEAMFQAIEPGASYLNKSPKDVVCKIITINQTSDTVTQAVKLHPYQTAKHPTLHRRMLLVAGSIEFAVNGLDLVDLEWDSKTSGRTKTDLEEIGLSAQRHMLKVEASSFQMMVSAVPVFTTIARKGGYKQWEPNHVLLGVYPVGNDENYHIKLTRTIDPQSSRRGHSEHRVILGHALDVKESEDKVHFWSSLIKAHLSMSQDLRFVPNFSRYYFVCGDNEDPLSSILIVKLDWEGNPKSEDVVLENYKDRVSVTRRPGGEAFKTVTDLETGKAIWDGSYVAF